MCLSMRAFAWMNEKGAIFDFTNVKYEFLLSPQLYCLALNARGGRKNRIVAGTESEAHTFTPGGRNQNGRIPTRTERKFERHGTLCCCWGEIKGCHAYLGKTKDSI